MCRFYNWGECCIVPVKTKKMKNLAIVLMAIGILMTVFTGFNVLTKKKVVDLGAVEINKTEKTPIYWSPITGLVILGAGVVVLLVSRRKAL